MSRCLCWIAVHSLGRYPRPRCALNEVLLEPVKGISVEEFYREVGMLRFCRQLTSKLVVITRAPGSTALVGCTRGNKMSTSDSRKIAFVSINEETQRLLVSFRLEDKNVKDRLYSINRSLDEAVEIALNRARANLQVAVMNRLKKKKKKKVEDGDEQTTPTFDIHLEDSQGKILEPFLTNREAFKTGHVLQVGDHRYSVIVNAPTVVRLSLPKRLIAECPVQAYVVLEHAELGDCVFSWWLSASKFTALDKHREEDVQKVGIVSYIRVPGETSNIFYPSEEDIGKKLMVQCEPRKGEVAGVSIREAAPTVIVSKPEGGFYEERFEFTREVLPEDKFRVVSYNLLANIYAHTAYSRKALFGYCPSDALDFDYRKHLLMREILAYNADLLCLQEVDRSMFSKDLYPCLSLRGFDGQYSEKTGSTAEGGAIFFRESKFELVEKSSLTYSQAIQELDYLSDLKEAVNANHTLKQKLSELHQMLQHVALKHKSTGKHLLVCNTHLYSSPSADNIRLLQALTALRVLEKTADKFKENDSECASIVCGDFNSTPEFAVYQLFTTGHVPKDSPDWASEADERIHGVVSKIKRTMKSACGTPEFTNYTVDFKGCLDYIFHSEEIVVDSVVPLPPEHVLANEEYQAIPSPIFPSDHIALIANLKFGQ